ncbi:PREDICTED: uncharacterized protein K02A2.6-like [Priapulus caudatus]|uniref:Uncharacterized protein K02A2.6-like n=1 Tax=Priapulus caudatus TaxID=37621 RepID=A0ABM1EUE2_PRICU|nr:PREDICTED: uncharacterized protein K02A2.6-like [Priapulus caudatus]
MEYHPTKDIIELVTKCETCQEAQPSQPSEPLFLHAILHRPWHTLASDLFEYDGLHYLVLGDYYTKFPFVRNMPSHCPSRTVIATIKQIFGEHGIPKRVLSDNGPHYNNQEYRAFAAHWGFEIVTTSPRRPKGNGFMERTLQTVKHTLKKANDTNTDFDLALLMLRAIPISNKLDSPAELLFSRKLQTILPAEPTNTFNNKDDIHTELPSRQQTQNFCHDRTARKCDLPHLQPGQIENVCIQHPETQKWNPATFQSKCDQFPAHISFRHLTVIHCAEIVNISAKFHKT